MTETEAHDKNQDLTDIQPEGEIEILPSDITVIASDKDNVEHQFAYQETLPSDLIADSTIDELDLHCDSTARQKLTAYVEQVKTTPTLDFELSIPEIKEWGLPKISFLKFRKGQKQTITKKFVMRETEKP